MNENIDLTKILEGCPKGTEFYSTVFGKVYFNGFINYATYPIQFIRNGSGGCVFAKDGRVYTNYDGECVIFPSRDQRDWSKFERFWDKPKIGLDIFEPFDKVLVRNKKTELWLLDMFAFHVEQNVAKTLNGAYMQCIPYNEETKHLLGTNNDCLAYYKWGEENKL